MWVNLSPNYNERKLNDKQLAELENTSHLFSWEG